QDDFPTAHIPGAQLITLADVSVSDPLTLQLPPIEKLTSAFEGRGISPDSRIIIYAGVNSVTPCTRVIWTLAYYGLGDHVSLLDGGLNAWRSAGKPVTSEIKTPASGKLTPHLHPEIFADANWVLANLHKPGVSLIDARMAHSYTGDGHIPGAQNIPVEELMSDTGQLKKGAAVADIFNKAGVRHGNQVVSYCYIGQRATLIWFLARMQGYSARVYDGSWQDWSMHHSDSIEK
ncbi:MAG TPA: rhodanese-like domain-containing protein, partial [Verrucomicrobiae bacterium]|nr:rhodanese-like domain-containing protein [Verrucomicrobiae bacterium]